MTPTELADHYDRTAGANERLAGGPTYESEQDRATASHLRDHQRLLDLWRVADAAISAAAVCSVYEATEHDQRAVDAQAEFYAHLRRIADAIEENTE